MGENCYYKSKVQPSKNKSSSKFSLRPWFLHWSLILCEINFKTFVPWKGSFWPFQKLSHFWILIIRYFGVCLLYKNSFVILFGDINERLYADDVLQLLECILWHLLENESLKTRSSLTWKLQRKMATIFYTGMSKGQCNLQQHK